MVKKKVAFAQEPQKKDVNFEDNDMKAIFGHPNKASKTNIRKKIFGKLRRSLSVDFMHKKKASRRASKDSGSKMNEAPAAAQLTSAMKAGEAHFDLEVDALVEFENLSNGYASDKNTDVASIELLDDCKPRMHRRKNRSRNRNRRLNRLQKVKFASTGK